MPRNLMRILLVLLFCFILMLEVTVTRLPVQPQAASTTKGPAMTSAQASSIYYGVYVPGWLNNLSALTTFENDAGKKAAIVAFYQGWGLTDGTQYFETSWMNNVRERGAIPLVTWEPWLYTAGVTQPRYTLRAIINGNFDPYIRKWAKASKDWGHPYFLRFAEEMNGNWFPWSEQVNGNRPGEYIKAWRHVRDIFKSLGVTNVTWVWSANVGYNGSIPLSEVYPGDGYVDWLGLDGYNWGAVDGQRWQTFSEVFSQAYNEVLGISTKPLMIAEVASTEQGGDKANWIMDAFTTALPGVFPKIKAVVWFNENKETDWRIESSSSAQAAFARAIQARVYSSNDYASLSDSPIPIP